MNKSSSIVPIDPNTFFDFEHLIRTNSQYRENIYCALLKISSTYKDVAKGAKYKALHQEALQEYLKLSNYNIAPLLGYYYPNYPEGPYSLSDFPFAYCYYTLNIGPGAYTVFRGSRQIGKCIHPNSFCAFRNKKTGEIKKMTIREFFNLAKGNK